MIQTSKIYDSYISDKGLELNHIIKVYLQFKTNWWYFKMLQASKL